jgi:hypothetical protein
MMIITLFPCKIDPPKKDIINKSNRIILIIPIHNIHNKSGIILSEKSVIEIFAVKTLLEFLRIQSIVLIRITSLKRNNK